MLKFPPERSYDTKMAASIYSFFRIVMPHTDKQIAKFESRHRRIIKAKVQLSPLKNDDDDDDTSNQHVVAKGLAARQKSKGAA